MDLMFSVLLVLGLLMLAGLIFVGYYSYADMKQKASLTSMFAQKEKDIMELYDSLEKMMEELDRFVYQSKLEIEEERRKALELYASGGAAQVSEKTPGPEVKAEEDEESARPELTEKEMLIQKVASKQDSKSGKVLSLYRQGVSVQNIAKMMNMGRGEVQLLIDLKNKNK